MGFDPLPRKIRCQSARKALSNGAIPKLNFLVSGLISVVMSTFSVLWLSHGRSGNEFCAEVDFLKESR